MRRILLSLALVVACATEPPPPPVPGQLELGDGVLLTVDGRPVTQRLLDIGLRPLTEAQRNALAGDEQRKRELVQRMAVAEVLYQRALERELHTEPEVRDALALAQREILANMMLEKIGQEAITDQSIQERYEAMAVQFKRPGAHIQHILVKRQDQAESLATKIRAGEIDFLAAAKAHSIDRNVTETGGDLGWTVRPPARELQQAWESAELGQVVGPVEGRLGYHLLKVVERRDTTPLDEVRDRLAETLKVEAMQSARTQIMNEADIQWVGMTGPGASAAPAPPPAAQVDP